MIHMRHIPDFFYDTTTQAVIDADWLEWHKLPRRHAEPVVRVKRAERDNYRIQDEDALPDEWDLSDMPEPTESDLRDAQDMLHQMGINDPETLDPVLVDKWFNQGQNA